MSYMSNEWRPISKTACVGYVCLLCLISYGCKIKESHTYLPLQTKKYNSVLLIALPTKLFFVDKTCHCFCCNLFISKWHIAYRISYISGLTTSFSITAVCYSFNKHMDRSETRNVFTFSLLSNVTQKLKV